VPQGESQWYNQQLQIQNLTLGQSLEDNREAG
jgi:hypothetical protein